MTDVVIERPTEPSVVIGLAEKLKLADANVSVSKWFHCEDSNHAPGTILCRFMPNG